MTVPIADRGHDASRFVNMVRRLVLAVMQQQQVPRTTWGVVSNKTGTTPPKYNFTPEGASAAIGGASPVLFPYLGANAPANGETVMGMWVGSDLLLVYRQTGTS